MSRSPDKWFSLRTDFFGRDSYDLGIYNLSAAAVATFVASAAHVSRWGTDQCDRHVVTYLGIKRPGPVIDQLVSEGFWVRALEPKRWHVAHEGALWRRGSPNQRRSVPVHIRAEVMRRDGYACVECGSDRELSMDHVWPYSRGGGDEVSNLRVLCRSCNSKKGARTDGA